MRGNDVNLEDADDATLSQLILAGATHNRSDAINQSVANLAPDSTALVS